MNRSAEALLEQVDDDVRLVDGAARTATDQALLERLSSVARLRRMVQAEATALAREVARRSENRDDSLARKQGASSAANLLSQITGKPRTTATTVVASGEAFRQREAIIGESLPAACPQIATAFAAGRLDPEVAAARAHPREVRPGSRSVGAGSPGARAPRHRSGRLGAGRPARMAQARARAREPERW